MFSRRHHALASLNALRKTRQQIGIVSSRMKAAPDGVRKNTPIFWANRSLHERGKARKALFSSTVLIS